MAYSTFHGSLTPLLEQMVGWRRWIKLMNGTNTKFNVKVSFRCVSCCTCCTQCQSILNLALTSLYRIKGVGAGQGQGRTRAHLGGQRRGGWASAVDRAP